MSGKRISRRKRQRRVNSTKPSRSALVAKKIFIVFIFLLSQLLFYHSDFFKIKDITVHGNRRVSDQKILQTANIPIGKNVIPLSFETFRKQVKTIHWVKDARIEWSPSGRINIYIKEREPVVLVRQNGKPGEWFAADQNGVVLYKAGEEEIDNYPRLVVNEPVHLQKKVDPDKIKTVQNIHPWIKGEVREKTRFYMVDEQQGVVIISRRMGRLFKIKVGKVENMKQKMKVLEAFLNLINREKKEVDYIDLRHRVPVISVPEDKKQDKEGAQEN